MPTSRYISRLRLSAFRNYQTAALDLDSRHVVLVGPNGAGKTNLLEAISLLSPGRGLRRAVFDEVAALGSDGAWAGRPPSGSSDGGRRPRKRYGCTEGMQSNPSGGSVSIASASISRRMWP